MTDYIAEAITEAFGERCSDYADYCPCCEAWRLYDALASATPPDVAELIAELADEADLCRNETATDIADLLDRAATALRLSAGGGWRTMDSAPKDGQPFMVYVAESDMGPHCFAPVSRDTGGDWWDDSTGDCIEPIKGATHWRPLPAPPAEGK